MPISADFMMDLRTSVKQITSDAYIAQSKKLWWKAVAKEMTSMSAKERLVWFLSTAQIRVEDEGSATNESLVTQSHELEPKYASAELRIKRIDLEDVVGGIPGGSGMNQASEWARQVGSQMAYWPQKVIAQCIRANPTTYDGKAFFAADHPLNPYRLEVGTYSNLINASVLNAAGLGAAAPAIHQFGSGAVDVDKAFENLGRALAYIGTIKTPNGVDPRNLTPVGILYPTAMRMRTQQLTNAKFIAQAVASAGGSGDIEAVVRDNALGSPMEAPELGASYGSANPDDGVGSNTSFYIVASSLGEEMAGMTYLNREPFSMNAVNGSTDASLLNDREFVWQTQGRNAACPGHPFQLFRVDGV